MARSFRKNKGEFSRLFSALFPTCSVHIQFSLFCFDFVIDANKDDFYFLNLNYYMEVL